MVSTKLKLCGYTFCECSITIALFVGSIVLQFSTPFKRGAFQNDTSISVNEGHQTVPLTVAGFYALAAPILAIFIIEISQAYRQKFPRVGVLRIPQLIIDLYKYIGKVTLGFAVMLIILQVAKFNVGRLRPFFFEACKPTNMNPSGYTENIICSGEKKLVSEARLSFPSGHSGCGAFGALFTSMYLQYRMPRIQFVMLRPLLQVSAFAIGYFICLSRIHDNWHHPVDVIVGSLIGVLATIIVFGLTETRSNKNHGTENSLSEGY